MSDVHEGHYPGQCRPGCPVFDSMPVEERMRQMSSSDMLADLLVRMGSAEWEQPERRQPEPEDRVYALGHYELMLVSKACADAVFPGQGYALNEAERGHLRALLHVFDGHGTVTILRRDDG